jgi:hypothetical protein
VMSWQTVAKWVCDERVSDRCRVKQILSHMVG